MTVEDWNERYGERGLLWSAEPNCFLVPEIAGMEPGRALDLACGEGRNAVWLAGMGWAVTGVDFSPVAVEKARHLAEQAGVDVEWHVADVTDWEPPATYDLVIVFYLHLPSEGRRAALERARRSLAPGGTLLVVGHALRNLTDGYGGPPAPEVLYSAADIRAELGDLVIERADEVDRPVEEAGVNHTAIDVLVRARR